MSLEEPFEKEPPSAEERLVATLLSREDRRYLEALRGADLLGELDTEELIRVGSAVEELDAERRWVQLLALYYAGTIFGESGDFQEAEPFLQKAIKLMQPDRRPIDALRKFKAAERDKPKKKRLFF